uniref:Glycosyl transferase CAP10 domain-containing protein n=1 Tax=Kwoniella dejecticola CBS 10117 TaxID=1296121 RepID=A0A1A6AHA8_9TREE|nr:uncharacterized protein I303_01287 [Kwoniella dejecticola CBS 10117]OBR89460.1 hypothetical protein I303_01287 [Kwoniella dejecticola CBS 10117]
MAFRIPTPRRGIRSLLVLLFLLVGPYLLLKHLSIIGSGSSRDLPRTNSDLLKNRLAGKKDELVIKRESEEDQSFFKLGAFLNDDDDNEEAESRDGIRNRNKKNLKAKSKSKVKPKARSKGNSNGNGQIQFHDSEQGEGVGEEEQDEVEEITDRGSRIKSKPSHRFLDNGYLIPNIHAPHPIFELIKRSKDKWQRKMDKQSKTLSEGVDEYRRRYARDPPKGFERWWAYAERNGVQLKDEYDQIYHDLEPFHALPPTKLQNLLRESSEMSGMYTISCHERMTSKCIYKIVEKGLNEEGKRVAKERAIQQLGLLEDVEELLEEVKVVMYSHDVPWQFVGHEYKGALEDAAAVGEFFNPEEHERDTAHLGWASACAPHKPLRHDYDPETLPDLEGLWSGDKTFVWDHKATMDPCIHPTLTHLVGFLSGHGKGPGPSKELYPVLAMCKTTLHADVLGVSMEAWTEDVGDDPIWEDKRDDRMLWRGKTTGIYFKDEVPWNISQRINLVSKTAEPLGHIPVFDVPALHNPNKPVGAPRNTPLSQLNAELMDVAFVDEAIQCDRHVCRQIQEGYKFAGRKDWSQGNQYKYLLDIDGNGWSARFKRLMTTNSVVLKSTIFPEWYTDRIQPWVHYIPIKADLTDVYDVLSFFRTGHDDLAKEIAVKGTEWSKSFWRKEDMIAYQFRLFLEYARLLADNRQEASFSLKGEDLRKRDAEYDMQYSYQADTGEEGQSVSEETGSWQSDTP